MAPGSYTATVTAHERVRGTHARSSAQLHVDGAVLARHTSTGTVSERRGPEWPRRPPAALRGSWCLRSAALRPGRSCSARASVPQCKPRTERRSQRAHHPSADDARAAHGRHGEAARSSSSRTPGRYDALTVSAYGGGALKSPRGLGGDPVGQRGEPPRDRADHVLGPGQPAPPPRASAAGFVRPDRTSTLGCVHERRELL